MTDEEMREAWAEIEAGIPVGEWVDFAVAMVGSGLVSRKLYIANWFEEMEEQWGDDAE
jgi:hypothetical protein